jgi:hypothetical protein
MVANLRSVLFGALLSGGLACILLILTLTSHGYNPSRKVELQFFAIWIFFALYEDMVRRFPFYRAGIDGTIWSHLSELGVDL